SHRGGSQQASTVTAGSHPGAPLEEDTGQQNSSFLGVNLTSTPFTIKHTLRSSAGGLFGSLSGCATQWRSRLERDVEAETTTAATRLVFRLYRISKLTQLRAQTATNRRPKGQP
ncbi:hypothetical protein HID58_032867, partial [Brassica napus]